jgi:catechol 2,3-dioxygenase-like lactoylglutathione lyase family enzyme
MHPRIDIITIGADDLDAARRFLAGGLGCEVRSQPGDALALDLGPHASTLELRPWDAVAADAGVPSGGDGFRGFTLSYIVDTAQAVDDVLGRSERHGGVIAKPPKRAVWGYSAYVSDPAGNLWKIASSQLLPAIRRTGTANGHAVRPKEVPITLGVADIARAKAFYRDGLGLPVKKDYRKFVMFGGDERASDIGLYTRAALAADAAVPAAGGGFPGFTLTHMVDSRTQVDALLEQAARAGGRLVRPAAGADGAYSGVFADPDGNVWKVAARG